MSIIYIMTNKAYEGIVKIGATNRDVEERRKELSNQTGVLYPFELYATYETPVDLDTDSNKNRKELKDLKLHKMISILNPDLKVVDNREFYSLKPEDALKLFVAIAEIAGNKDKITTYFEDDTSKFEDKTITNIRTKFSFNSAGIEPGSKIVFIYDENEKAEVVNDSQVKYKGEIYSVSALAKKLLKVHYGVCGYMYFKCDGDDETLTERRKHLEKEGKYN